MHPLVRALAMAPAIVTMACSSSPPIVLGDAGPRDAGAPDAELPGADAGVPMRVVAEPAGSLHTGRMSHTTTLLPNGHVVVIGGETLAARAPLRTIEDYDPATDAWTEVAALPTPRANHTATLLEDGRVLVVGGGANTANGLPSGENVTDAVYLYDPATHEVTTAASLSEARGHHAAVRVADGSVLVIGGAAGDATGVITLASAERYLPDADEWVGAGALETRRAMHRVVLDAEGDPLVLGGLRAVGSFSVTNAVERWRDGAFETTSWLPGGGRIYHAVMRTDDGDVLVAGGLSTGLFLTAFERLAAGTDAFTAVGELPSPRNSMALAATDQGVLLVGGFMYDGVGTTFQDVLLYDPETENLELAGLMPVGRSGHHAVTLPSGEVLVVGGFGPLSELDQTLRLRVVAP